MQTLASGGTGGRLRLALAPNWVHVLPCTKSAPAVCLVEAFAYDSNGRRSRAVIEERAIDHVDKGSRSKHWPSGIGKV